MLIPRPYLLHLASGRREALSDVLPSRVCLALALDHLRAEASAPEKALLEGSLFPTLSEALETGLLEILGDRFGPRAEFERLMGMPSDIRQAAVASAQEGFSCSELCRLLAEKSTEVLAADPEQANGWAQLCQQVSLKGSTRGHRLFRVHSLMLIANTYRALQDHAEAEEFFRLAEVQERSLTVEDMEGPLASQLRARQSEFLASWYRDRGDFAAALTVCNRRAVEAQLTGDVEGQARACIKAGTIHFEAGLYRRAVSDFRVAKALVSRTENPLLWVAVELNLAMSWSKLGYPWRGLQGVLLVRPILEDFPDARSLHLRSTWLTGHSAASRGSHNEAISAYGQALKGFVDLNRPYDAIQVGFEFTIYLVLSGQSLDNLADELLQVIERQVAKVPSGTRRRLQEGMEVLLQAKSGPTLRLRELIDAQRRFHAPVRESSN